MAQTTDRPVTALFASPEGLRVGLSAKERRVHRITDAATATNRGLILHGALYNKENVAGLPDDNISFALRLSPVSVLLCHSLTAPGILRPSQRRFYPLSERPLSAHHITSALLDGRGHRVLLASQRGMWPLSQPAMRLSPLFAEGEYADLGEKYNCLLLTHDGGLWLGTSTGLIRVGKGMSMAGECVQALLESRDHRYVWVATSGRVVRIDECTGRSLSFGHRDGLLPSEIYERAIVELPDGRIAVGSMAGVSYITPPFSQKRKATSRRPLSVVGITLMGEEVEADGLFRGRTLFRGGYLGLEGLTLAYDENFLTVRVSAMCLSAPHRLRYRYRLEGSGQDWQEAAARDGRIACAYTRLAPGRYTLRVEGEGRALVLPITVRPPLWQIWWAKALYVLLFVIAIVECVRIYQHLRRRRMLLLARVRRALRRVSPRGREVRLKAIELPNHDDELLRRITASIETHIAEPDYGVDALASDVGIARTPLYRKMRQIASRTPSDFILVLRLQRAAQLLKETDLTISEVAYHTGFNTPRTFAARFRATYGCLPKDYKNKPTSPNT